MKFAVESHEDGPQAAPGVRPQHAKSLAVAGRGTDPEARGKIVAGLGRIGVGGEVGYGRGQLGVAQAGEPLARRATAAIDARLFSTSPSCFLT